MPVQVISNDNLKCLIVDTSWLSVVSHLTPYEAETTVLARFEVYFGTRRWTVLITRRGFLRLGTRLRSFVTGRLKNRCGETSRTSG